MIAGFEDFCLYVYVIVDDCPRGCRGLAQRRRVVTAS